MQSTIRRPRCVIFDIDNTLVLPSDQSYYNKFGIVIHEYIRKVLGVSEDELARLVKYYRKSHRYLEYALIDREMLMISFKDLGLNPVSIDWERYQIAYKDLYNLSMLNLPHGYFKPDYRVNRFVTELRNVGYVVIALSNCPEGLSRRILDLCGFNPDTDFDHYRPWLEGTFAPPKIHYEDKIFVELAKQFEFNHDQVLSVGDSLVCDILTAKKVGMQTCHISDTQVSSSHTISHVLELKSILL
jgi:FMN phosphatase YigB (HAD superfamily)